MWRGRFTSSISGISDASLVPLTWRFTFKGLPLIPAALDPIGV